MTDIQLPAIHPGEILREEYLKPLGISPIKLARMIGVPRTRVERIVKEQTSVTLDTAFRFGKVFKTTPGFWLNMQSHYDLATADIDVSDIDVLEMVS